MTPRSQSIDGEHAIELAASAVKAMSDKGVFIPANIRERISELQAEGERIGADVDDDLRVALAGKYSCGKSSFINSALGPEWESLAPVKLERTTRCATNFRYGEALRITDKDGRVYSPEEYQDKVATVAANSTFLEFTIELPVESLRDLVVIDTPGFDPPEEDVGEGNKTDAEISRDAVDHADLVLFLMEMSDGTIQKDSVDYLQEVAKSGKPFYLILSKADLKKPASKRIEIISSIREECKRYGLRPIGILPYCAKREDSLPSSVRQDAATWRENLHTVLDGLANFKQTLLGSKTQVIRDNYVANVQAFLKKNRRFFEALQRHAMNLPAETTTEASMGGNLTTKQVGQLKLLFSLLQSFARNECADWAVRLPSGQFRLSPDVVRSALLAHADDMTLDSDFYRGVAQLLPKVASEQDQREIGRQIIAVFANQAYQATAKAMQVWSFDAASTDRLSYRFSSTVLPKIDKTSFSATVADVVEAYKRSGTTSSNASPKGNLNQWLNELIELSR